MTRKILYVSGTRADFGLMESTLVQAARHPELDVAVCVTGAHLQAEFGATHTEVDASGLRVCARIPAPMRRDDGASMARQQGHLLGAISDLLEKERPDIVLVLGDRGEMLAAALAAAHAGIVVAHAHGGERSGTIDESVRHAISKVAHYHFAATEASRTRLVRMGERPDTVFVTGAPGLDGLAQLVRWNRAQLADELGLDAAQPIALVIYHPVLQESRESGLQAAALLEALEQSRLQSVCLLPNSDAGNVAIRDRLLAAESRHLRTFVHLPRAKYVSWMAAADVMVGNSSSGIIEAASFHLPVVNIGDRQMLRERSGNVVDCPPQSQAIRAALAGAAAMKGRRFENAYGDGRAGERIVAHLATIGLEPTVLKKSNAY